MMFELTQYTTFILIFIETWINLQMLHFYIQLNCAPCNSASIIHGVYVTSMDFTLTPIFQYITFEYLFRMLPQHKAINYVH